ncbi:unnamed protein product [Closterium sp. NIES-53]
MDPPHLALTLLPHPPTLLSDIASLPWDLLLLLSSRLSRAFLAPLSLPALLSTLLLLFLLAPPIYLCARWSDALSLPHARFDPLLLLQIAFVPCLFEETLFRVLLLPHPAELSPDVMAPDEALPFALFWWLLSTALFVFYHPACALLFREPAVCLFTHPGFLLACFLLGGGCAWLYLSVGSVWPCVAVHWVVVAVWLSLGGHHQAPL